MDLAFTGSLSFCRGPAPFHFVTSPSDCRWPPHMDVRHAMRSVVEQSGQVPTVSPDPVEPSEAGRTALFEELRRRVYEPDASEEDRARYRAAVEYRDRYASAALPQTPDPSLDQSAAPPPPPPPPPRRRRLRQATVGVLLLVVAAVAVVVGFPRAAGPRDTAPATVRVDAPERSELLQNLAAGKVAGISAYLLTHSSLSALRTATRFVTTEWRGKGSRTITTPSASGQHGRVTVLLVLATGAHAEWSAVRTSRDGVGRMRLVVLATRSGDQQAGIPTTATFPTTTQGGPDRLLIVVPRGVQWGAEMVLTD
ncbi:hypothetical protein [uncultured Amnibacterium sp.]|uniref:hypothetical protein n=1 Tax=uncultured Amnibacterium sp. TaxID=1631851 RepID=UPI0035CBF742